MKALPTLVRIAKRDLDILQRGLGELNLKRAEVDNRIAAHDQSIAQEQALAIRDYEGSRAFSGYIGGALAGRQRLLEEGRGIDLEIERLRDLISAAHIEMRKFERLLEMQDEREKAQRERREDAEMDERATLRAGRKPLV